MIRDEFVTKVKEYISTKPDYQSTLHEIKIEALLNGATEEEFKEALRQVTIPQVTSPSGTVIPFKTEQPIQTETPNQKGGKAGTTITKKMLELDMATHLTTAVLLLFAIFLLGSIIVSQGYPNILASLFGSSHEQISSVTPVTQLPNQIVPQVYANTVQINPAAIFAIPPSSITLSQTGRPKKTVLGFFPYWLLDDQEKVSLNALTAIDLFGLTTDGKGNVITKDDSGGVEQGWAMWNDPRLDIFIRRAKSRNIQVNLVMKAFNNADIENLILSDKAQKTFIANTLTLINQKSLKGVNIDFEYTGDANINVTNAFTRFITNLHVALQEQIPTATLTIDTYITTGANPEIFDLNSLQNQVDAFVVMGYDIHTPQGSPGPVAPMEGDASILGYMQSYLEKVPPTKLVLAVPYYGYDWTIPSNSAPAQVFPYAEIAQQVTHKTITWDDISQTPSFQYVDPQTKQTHQVYFDNTRSLGIKYDYVNRKNLQGIAIWALGYDGLNPDLRELIIEKFSH